MSQTAGMMPCDMCRAWQKTGLHGPWVILRVIVAMQLGQGLDDAPAE